jgi:carbon storage regulator
MLLTWGVVQPPGGLTMIVVSRAKNEALVLDHNIIVTVIEIRGDKVRLGFEHPEGTTVHRREVYDAIRRQLPPESDNVAKDLSQGEG